MTELPGIEVSYGVWVRPELVVNLVEKNPKCTIIQYEAGWDLFSIESLFSVEQIKGILGWEV